MKCDIAYILYIMLLICVLSGKRGQRAVRPRWRPCLTWWPETASVKPSLTVPMTPAWTVTAVRTLLLPPPPTPPNTPGQRPDRWELAPWLWLCMLGVSADCDTYILLVLRKTHSRVLASELLTHGDLYVMWEYVRCLKLERLVAKAMILYRRNSLVIHFLD